MASVTSTWPKFNIWIYEIELCREMQITTAVYKVLLYCLVGQVPEEEPNALLPVQLHLHKQCGGIGY